MKGKCLNAVVDKMNEEGLGLVFVNFIRYSNENIHLNYSIEPQMDGVQETIHCTYPTVPNCQMAGAQETYSTTYSTVPYRQMVGVQ